MHEVTKEIKWAMAHRLTHGYEGKCKNIHGHSYKTFVTLGGVSLNRHGMVIDFGDIKRLVQKWIDDNWDHAMLVDSTDKSMIDFLKKENQRHYVIEENCNSTAEWMSKFLYNKIEELLKINNISVHVKQVVVYETDTSYACYKKAKRCECGGE